MNLKLQKYQLTRFPFQVVGQKQQTLEVGEEQSMIREEKLQKQIYELNVKLSMANARSDILRYWGLLWPNILIQVGELRDGHWKVKRPYW